MAIEALYLHIPFCHAKCAYCDFDSRALCGAALDAAAEACVGALFQRIDAFGARGVRVTNIAELRDALREAMKRTGPVLIDAQIDKDERVLPMIPAGGTVDDLVTE